MQNLESLALMYDGSKIQILDQQALPQNEFWLDCTKPEDMEKYIKSLQVRGAPMIRGAAVLSLADFYSKGATEAEFRGWAQKLRDSRPTAVNLMHAIDYLTDGKADPDEVKRRAIEVFEKDVELCRKIAENGNTIIEKEDQILTHCNTGGLATAGVGTALGIIRKAHEDGKDIHVWVDETRPLLQGGRLTAWEMLKLGIPSTLITDSMAAMLMAQGRITKCIVGADRIAANGDFANKIGTYGLAVLCYYHRIPFYVAAPATTIDLSTKTGQDIPIEQRNPDEIRSTWAPKEAQVYNPAFDSTPAEFVTGWILDTGVYNHEDIKKGALKCGQ